MSNTLNDTMKTTMHGVEAIREGTEHTLASTLSMLARGVSGVSGVVALVRSLDRDHGLAWLGIARRSRPLRDATLFAFGVATGAVASVLLTPASRATVRTALLDRFRASKPGAKAKLGCVHANAGDMPSTNHCHSGTKSADATSAETHSG